MQMERQIERDRKENETADVDHIIGMLRGRTITKDSYFRILDMLENCVLVEDIERERAKREMISQIKTKWSWDKDAQRYEEKKPDFIDEKEMQV